MADSTASSDPEAWVELDHPGPGVWRLTLNRAGNFNALSSEMMTALNAALMGAGQAPDCRVVVLAARGKAFCAGHDLREMLSLNDMAAYQALFAQCSRLMLAIQTLPQPVVAQVQGIATAAGCQLVAVCDLAVAVDSAQFAVSGIRHGLFCATPSVALSRNMHRKQAMEMLLTGEFIDAETAVSRGLVNRAVPVDQLSSAVLDLCASIVAKPEAAVRMGKALFYRQLELGQAAAYELAGQTMACNMLEPSAREGFQAFLEKRTPQW